MYKMKTKANESNITLCEECYTLHECKTSSKRSKRYMCENCSKTLKWCICGKTIPRSRFRCETCRKECNCHTCRFN